MLGQKWSDFLYSAGSFSASMMPFRDAGNVGNGICAGAVQDQAGGEGLCFFVFEMLFDQLQHHRSQQEDTNEVGYDHKTVEGIADAPDKT